ncbi:MAG: DNA circularization N-terminal domain-containing protein [Geobacteraceae bacterium]|nr:DNA circularization N-terminal domain-containing protein [Geobacteraceae bacterium]
MTLYDAAIDGIPLEIETLDDAFEASIARHEFPYKDGALLENMGQKARTVTIRCYFWDDGSHLTYNDHIKLVNHLKDKALFKLTHPMYGTMQGMIERVGVRADDRELTAEVDITFVENMRQDLSEVEYQDVETAADQAVIDAQDEQMDQFKADAQDGLGAEAPEINDQELDPGQGILEQFSGVSQKARAWLKEVDSAVATFEGALNEMTQPANSLIATINYGTKLPGRVIGSIAKMVDRYVALYNTVTTAPSRFLRNLRSAINSLIVTSGFSSRMKRRIRVAAAIQGAHAVAQYYAADEKQRQVLRRLEKQTTFDVQGRYLNPPIAEPVYTVNELEASLAESRDMIQEAIASDGGRSIQSLKAIARVILDHVNNIKLEREKIITVRLDNPMPLHIICLRYGLDYHYAERLSAINSIPRPNFTDGAVRIYIGPGEVTP